MVTIYLVRHAQTYYNVFIDCIEELDLSFENIESYLLDPPNEFK